jgi:hypothetical protein
LLEARAVRAATLEQARALKRDLAYLLADAESVWLEDRPAIPFVSVEPPTSEPAPKLLGGISVEPFDVMRYLATSEAWYGRQIAIICGLPPPPRADLGDLAGCLVDQHINMGGGITCLLRRSSDHARATRPAHRGLPADACNRSPQHLSCRPPAGHLVSGCMWWDSDDPFGSFEDPCRELQRHRRRMRRRIAHQASIYGFPPARRGEELRRLLAEIWLAPPSDPGDRMRAEIEVSHQLDDVRMAGTTAQQIADLAAELFLVDQQTVGRGSPEETFTARHRRVVEEIGMGGTPTKESAIRWIILRLALLKEAHSEPLDMKELRAAARRAGLFLIDEEPSTLPG